MKEAIGNVKNTDEGEMQNRISSRMEIKIKVHLIPELLKVDADKLTEEGSVAARNIGYWISDGLKPVSNGIFHMLKKGVGVAHEKGGGDTISTKALEGIAKKLAIGSDLFRDQSRVQGRS